MSDAAPLPCPFCGNTSPFVMDMGDDDWAVCCKDCGASSKFDDDADTAIAAWNLRAPSAEPELRAEVERLHAPLREARNFIQAVLDDLLDSYCLKDADGKPDISTLDDSDCGAVGEAMQALERIDAALGGGAVGS